MSDSLPVLYSFRRCPYAMRARFTLIYSGVQCALREVDLKNKPDALLEVSPKATVPVLVLPDDTVIDESLDVMRYALLQHDPDGWANDSPEACGIIQKNDHEFTQALHCYKYHTRYPDGTKEQYLEHAEEIFIKWLEARLQHSAYIMGEFISVVDIAIFPFIRQFVMADEVWFQQSPYTHIREWLQGFLDSPFYIKAMRKYSPWVSDDPIIML